MTESTPTSALLVDRIGELVTNDEPPILRDAAVVVTGDRITWVGPASRAPAADRRVDTGDAGVLPGFVDSHAHLVFAGDRAAEFAARMGGAATAGAASAYCFRCW